jgi:hypothetical protein
MKLKECPANFMVSCIAYVLFYSAILIHLYMTYLLKVVRMRIYRNLHGISFILPWEKHFIIFLQF